MTLGDFVHVCKICGPPGSNLVHDKVKKIYGLQKFTGGGMYRWAQDLTGQQVHDGTPPSEYDGS